MYWFTSDSHFFHSNIIKHCNRPYNSVEEMNESLINNWNSVVSVNDEVWSLGDFSFGNFDNTLNIIRRLNGYKHFILGNHCSDMQNRRKLYLDSKIVKSIQNYKELKIEGIKVCLFHYGQRVWNSSHYGKSYQLFGHSHGSLPPLGKSVDVGVDSSWITGKPEYRPFSFDEIKKFMEKQVIFKADNHVKGEM